MRSKPELKVLTINTWKGDGAYLERLKVLKTQISLLLPDIILVQEAFRTMDLHYCTVREIAEVIGFHYNFMPARKKMRKINNHKQISFSGMGILSRWPIKYAEAVTLPTNEQDGGRIGQFIIVQNEKKTFLFGNLHLSFLLNSDSLKIHQLEVFLKRIATFSGIDSFILGGDFNSLPESDTIQFLMHHSLFNVQDSQAGHAHGTFPADINQLANHRIDYIFILHPNHLPFNITLSSASICLDQPDENGIFASDHLGVMARFEI